MEPDPAPELLRQPLFTALTRPQMFAGVTYGFFIINVIITMELFLVTKSFWVIVPGLIVHFIGRLACYKYFNMDQVVGQALAAFKRMGAAAAALPTA